MASVATPRSKLRALGAGVGVGLAGIIVAFVLVGGVAGALRLLGVDLGVLPAIVLTLVLTQGVAFGGVAAGYLSWHDRSLATVGVRLPTLREAGVAVGGWLLSVGIVVAAGVVLQALNAPTATNQLAEIGAENPEVLLLLVPAAFVFIGPGEELLFRGVVQNRLRESFEPAAAVVLAAALFAAIHFLALSGSTGGRLVTLVVLFFPSLVFGAVYEYTGNLVVPAFIHAAYDATLFLALYATVKFGPGMGG